MKKLCFLSIIFLLNFSIYGQIINIPDVNFKNKLLHYSPSIDTNHDGEIQVNEASSVLNLDLSWLNISNLEGIQNFVNLKILKCNANNIHNLSVVTLMHLEDLDCGKNQMNSLNISGLNNLINLDCNHNNLNSINLSGLSNLEKLFVFDNAISSLDLSVLPKLTWLWCSNNQLSSLDLSNKSNLLYAFCDSNKIENLNLIGTTHLSSLSCGDNQLTFIDTNQLTELINLECYSNKISSINLLPMSLATHISCGFNPISILNLNGLLNLSSLAIESTLVSTIDCSQSGVTQLFCTDNPNLTSINVKNNHISSSDPDLLNFAFRFKNLPKLTSICVDSGEEYNVFMGYYNSTGNVIVYTGTDCSTIIPYFAVNVKDFEFNRYFSLYPNPSNDFIYIEVKEEIAVQSINIYSILGQMIKSVPNQNFGKNITLDVSQLKTGIYFVNLLSDIGKTSARFVKL